MKHDQPVCFLLISTPSLTTHAFSEVLLFFHSLPLLLFYLFHYLYNLISALLSISFLSKNLYIEFLLAHIYFSYTSQVIMPSRIIILFIILSLK